MFDTRVNLTRLEKEVLEYEKAEIEPGKILFWGDSGFTRWRERFGNRPLESVILGKDGSKAIVNHGIGGATAEELLFYYPRMVQAWKPRALVLKAYANDDYFGYSPREILSLQAKILDYARVHMPGIRFYLCDISVRTRYTDNDIAWHTWESRAYEYNRLLQEYCGKHEDCTYVCHSQSPLFFADPADVGDYRKVRRDILSKIRCILIRQDMICIRNSSVKCWMIFCDAVIAAVTVEVVGTVIGGDSCACVDGWKSVLGVYSIFSV